MQFIHAADTLDCKPKQEGSRHRRNESSGGGPTVDEQFPYLPQFFFFARLRAAMTDHAGRNVGFCQRLLDSITDAGEFPPSFL